MNEEENIVGNSILSDVVISDVATEEQPVSVFDNESIDSILQTLSEGDVRITPQINQATVDAPDVSYNDFERIVNEFQSEQQVQENQEVEVGVADLSTQTQFTEEAPAQEEAQVNSDVNDFINTVDSDFNKTNETNHENESRFSGAEWYEKVKSFDDVIIAGQGGIGSWCSLLVSRLHPRSISIFDNDNIEMANLSGQLYSIDQVGMQKCTATRKTIEKYSGYYMVNVFNERYNGQKTSDIMICGFDNMAARKLFIESWVNHLQSIDPENRKRCLFMDARLGLEELQIFTIRGDEEDNILRYYKDHLFSDAEAEQVPCSMKQTSFMASMIGSMMTNLLVNFATNIDEPMDIRPIPFLTLYNASDMRLQLKF